MELKPLNRKAYVMNAIIAVIAIASIAMLFIMSFWTLDLSIKIDGDMIDSLGLEETSGEESSDASMTETINELKKALNDDPVVISLKLDLTSSMLIGSLLSTDAEDTVEEFVTAQVSTIMAGLEPAFDSLQTVVVKVGAKAAISEAKKSLFAELNEEDSQKVETALNEVGLTDSYIDETVEGLMESLKTNPNIDSVANEITGIVEEVIDKVFKAVDKEDSQIADLLGEDLAEYASMAPEEKKDMVNDFKAELREDFPEALSEALREIGLVDADDNVNIEGLFTQLIASMINGDTNMGGGSEEGGNEGDPSYTPDTDPYFPDQDPYNAPVYSSAPALGAEEGSSSAGSSSTGSGSSEENSQTLEEMISELLMEKLASGESVEAILMVLKVLALIMIITAAVWVYLLVKLLVKTLLCKNKTVGLFIPRHIGWIAFVVFVGIPFVLNLAIGNPDIVNQALSNVSPDFSMDEIMGEAGPILENISIVCTSGSIGSAIGTVLLLFILLPYRSLRRKFRRAIKKNKLKNI